MRWLFAAFIFASSAQAEPSDWPGLSDVTGVAADDVLNIRNSPGADREIIGAFHPGDRGIEVLWPDESGVWGQVNSGERTGWVSLRFLTRQSGVADRTVPPITRCFGTEPFWSLVVNGDTLVKTGPQRAPTFYSISEGINAVGRPDRFALHAEGKKGAVFLRLGKAECSDGMSDRLYAIDADAMFYAPGAFSMHSGCCTIAAN